MLICFIVVVSLQNKISRNLLIESYVKSDWIQPRSDRTEHLKTQETWKNLKFLFE